METKPKNGNIQTSLFDDDELKNMVSETEIVPTIKKSGKKILSKEQKKFNALTKKIEEQKKDIEIAKQNALKINTDFANDFHTLEEKLGTSYKDLIITLDNFTSTIKLGKNQKEMFDDYINDLFDNAFEYIEPDEDLKKIFDKYNENSYDQMRKRNEEEMKDFLNSMVKNMTNVDVSDVDWDFNDYDSTISNAQKVYEKINQEYQKEAEKDKNRKKTKEEKEMEQMDKLKEELTNKSIRSIYISLAKALHPDTETDEKLKEEKTELMKKVTNAYDNKDITELLKLEAICMQQSYERLYFMPDEAIELYNEVLEDQSEELNDELFLVLNDPKNNDFSDLLLLSDNQIKRRMTEIFNDLEEDIIENERLINLFRSKNTSKSVLINLLKEHNEYYDFKDDFKDIFSNIDLEMFLNRKKK